MKLAIILILVSAAILTSSFASPESDGLLNQIDSEILLNKEIREYLSKGDSRTALRKMNYSAKLSASISNQLLTHSSDGTLKGAMPAIHKKAVIMFNEVMKTNVYFQRHEGGIYGKANQIKQGK